MRHMVSRRGDLQIEGTILIRLDFILQSRPSNICRALCHVLRTVTALRVSRRMEKIVNSTRRGEYELELMGAYSMTVANPKRPIFYSFKDPF